MEQIIEQWIKKVNFQNIRQAIGTREVAIWGAYNGGKQVENALLQLGQKVNYYIDGHKEATSYNGLPIIRPSTDIDRDKIYIIVAVVGVREEIIHHLNCANMKENMDYIYVSKMIPRVVLSECEGGYTDFNGNCVEFKDDVVKCRIECVGYNNKVTIGKRFQASDETSIIVKNGSQVVIGDDFCSKGVVEIESLGGGIVNIGDGCLISDESRISSKKADITFGNFVTAWKRFFCSSGSTAPITIGDDCMFSADVSIVSGGHSVIDLELRENTSLKNEKYINLGNHIWLGKNAVILHNADIGDGSIVGANSLVKIKTEPNCVIGGNPAKVLKKNKTWDRRVAVSFEDL